MNRQSRSPIHAACLLGLALALTVGCRVPSPLFGLGGFGQPRASHDERHVALLASIERASVDKSLQASVDHFTRAEAARHNEDPRCVSLYANAALACWPLLSPEDADGEFGANGEFGEDAKYSRDAQDQLAWKIYHESVEQLIACALEYDQIDLQKGITYTTDEGTKAFIKIDRYGFPWNTDDFNELHVIVEPWDAQLARYWSDPGLGVPLVVVRRREHKQDFLGTAIPYSATGILRPADDATTASISDEPEVSISTVAFKTDLSSASDPPAVAVLELHDPAYTTEVSYRSENWDLKRDISAPLGLALKEFHHHKYKSFLRPGKVDEDAGLRMIEPYQQGKIPIVLVHGLLSDRATWANLVNDLRSSTWFNQRYQIWFFQYQTGQPYIRSALEMRRALDDVVTHLDPQGSDPAMSQMVLVGHSMGGLVSKLQITSSGTSLWDSIALIPANEIHASSEEHQTIKDLFFFEPSPHVQRVLFIGSPHQGSALATSWIGVLGSALVRPARERLRSTRTIFHDNPGVFVDDVTKHIPTSIDLLRPENPLLQATFGLPVNPNVKLHTIIGNARHLKDGRPSDGVVAVESAQHPGTLSELLIDSIHTQLPDHRETAVEVTRILQEHSDAFENRKRPAYIAAEKPTAE